MGNSPSVHQSRGERGASSTIQDDTAIRATYPHTRNLMEMDNGRQNSITSQLFPSRKGRHVPGGLGNIMRKTQNAVPHPPSMFKNNYSLEGANAGVEASRESAGGAARTSSAESVRANMAGLSLKNSNETAGPMANPYFMSPGPATPTVQPTKEEATPIDDVDVQNLPGHRRSVVALKKSLQESEQSPSVSDSPSITVTRSNSIDIKPPKGAGVRPHQSHTGNRRNSVDTDFDSSDADNMSDDGYLQSKDIVLNQSVVHSMLRRDMKRKRGKEVTNSSNTNDLTAGAAPSKESTVEPSEHRATNQRTLDSQSSGERRGFSYESIESGHLPEIKKLKPISHDILLPHAADENPDDPHHIEPQRHFYSMDSFEKGSVEHREVEDETRKSSESSSASSSGASQPSEDVRVIIKWRDPIPEGASNKVSMVSEDIASTLSFEKQKQCGARNVFTMKFDPKSKEWYVPDLMLPAGIYRLQFLVNGEIRHSNYLPTATDSVGNFVNWFEVVPGYQEVEPYREEVEIDSKPLENEDISPASPGNHGQQSLVQPVPGKPERPPLAPMQSSSNRVLRSNTPHSDYTGISRSSSALRKSPLMQYTSSSLDLVTALQPKKYRYSSEIPELFKTPPATETNDENDDMTVGNMENPFPPSYGWPHYQKAGLNNKVVDCNQDQLFTHLQQGGALDAETAEQLFLDKYPVPDLPVYLNSYYLNKILSEFQKNNYNSNGSSGINHIIPHVNLNHLLTSSIRDEMISVGCTTRYEGKFITQVIYSPCYYEHGGNS